MKEHRLGRVVETLWKRRIRRNILARRSSFQSVSRKFLPAGGFLLSGRNPVEEPLGCLLLHEPSGSLLKWGRIKNPSTILSLFCGASPGPNLSTSLNIMYYYTYLTLDVTFTTLSFFTFNYFRKYSYVWAWTSFISFFSMILRVFLF